MEGFSMGNRTRLAGLLALLAAFGVFVASSSAAGSGGGLGKKAVTNYVKYVGGKAGKANPKLSPVQIGFFNQQGGAVVIGADATTGAQTAVKYANKNLGGIAGHPIKLVTCFIQSTEQQGTTCGQQFRANKNIDVIDEGGVGTGVDTLYAALGGTKPVIAGVAASSVDATQKNAVILLGDGLHVLAPYGTYAKQVLHAKTAAVVYENEPGIGPDAQAWISALKAEGITVNSVAYDPTQTDLTGPLTSVNAASADIVIPGTDANGCVAMAQALQQLGITNPAKIVANPLCLNASVISALGDFPKWTYGIATSLFGDASDPGLKPYGKVMTEFKQTKNAADPWNIANFATMLSTIRFLNQAAKQDKGNVAKITPKQVLKIAKAFKGPQALGAPSLDCGAIKSAPAVCNQRAQFFTYMGNNVFKKAASWLQPPPS
jgi:branched-chain amino acid transport system substrate-binding protein